MAADLSISASYVALLESNQRPLTADMLLRIVRTYKVDVDTLANDASPVLATRLQAVLRDPMFSDLDVPPLQDVDVATNYPAIAEVILRLHSTYREAQVALADRIASPANADGETVVEPVVEAQRYLAARRNYFPALETAAAGLAHAAGEAGGLTRLIQSRHGLRVRPMSASAMVGSIRRYDPHHRSIYLDERLDRASRRFQLAVQLLYLEHRELLSELAAEGSFSGDDGRRLARRALANYGAAAVLMPYSEFRRAAQERLYDVEALGRLFGTSFEQVAHRLTTLQRPGEAGIPFFFIRIDPAGNVSKRLDGAGFPFARHGGGCPLWAVHDAFRRPREVVTQWLELPDGQSFFSIARTVNAGGGSFNVAQMQRAVALCCSADDAAFLIYAQHSASPVPGRATPIGIGCALCHREACTARAVPPIGRALLPDDYHRRLEPFGFRDD